MPRFLLYVLATALILPATIALAAGDGEGSTLVWRGDLATSRAFMRDLAKAWAENSDYSIELQPFSTISGIDETLAGHADIAGSARPAFPERSQESGLVFTPVAWDALVMIVHPDNPVHHISLKDLRDVYYGHIENWEKLGGPDLPINLYSVASPLDGIEYSMRKYLFGRGDQPVASPRLYINTAQLESGVSIDPAGLGATTMSAVLDNKKLRMLSIEHVAPSPANVADGSYPLYIPLYLATSTSNPDAEAVEAFYRFLGTDKAADIMLAHHVLPYKAAAGLAVGHAEHIQHVVALSEEHMNGPVAAPGATYSSKVSIAPTSDLTAKARQRLEAAREQAKNDE